MQIYFRLKKSPFAKVYNFLCQHFLLFKENEFSFAVNEKISFQIFHTKKLLIFPDFVYRK